MNKTANDALLPLTLRELRERCGGPMFWLVIGFAILFEAISGPFYSLERFGFSERLIFWGSAIPPSAVPVTFPSVYIRRATDTRVLHWSIPSIPAGVSGIAPVVAMVYLANGLATGSAPGWLMAEGLVIVIASVASSVIAMTFSVNALNEFQVRRRANSAPDPDTRLVRARERAVDLTSLQRKLPHRLGHDIVSVRARDHNIEATTPKGSATVLMRLGDAIEDLVPLAGLQVHRSRWIDPVHVERMEKGANGPGPIMASGQRVPVGRSFRKALQDVAPGGEARQSSRREFEAPEGSRQRQLLVHRGALFSPPTAV